MKFKRHESESSSYCGKTLDSDNNELATVTITGAKQKDNIQIRDRSIVMDTASIAHRNIINIHRREFEQTRLVAARTRGAVVCYECECRSFQMWVVYSNRAPYLGFRYYPSRKYDWISWFDVPRVPCVNEDIFRRCTGVPWCKSFWFLITNLRSNFPNPKNDLTLQALQKYESHGE